MRNLKTKSKTTNAMQFSDDDNYVYIANSDFGL